MRALGVDIGGSKVLACVADETGAVHARQTHPTGRATDARAIVERIAAIAGAHEVSTIGVGFPGLVDATRGIAHSSVMLDGWANVPLAAHVTEATGRPCVVDNDVNCAAIAELHARDGEPPGAMLFAAIGTGIGGAIAFDGELWRGASGVAGEIGNTVIARDGARCWCGRRGCLNVLASGSAIEAACDATPGTLAERAASGDPAVVEAIANAAAHLGVGIANALNLINPSLVVLGGGIAELGERYLSIVERTARAEAFAEAARVCAFERARAGYDAGAIGAALFALNRARSARAI